MIRRVTPPRRLAIATLSPSDILRDAARTCRSRPGRTVGLGLAVALGVATFVGVLSMSAAADAQVARRIAALRPELVTVRPLVGSEHPWSFSTTRCWTVLAKSPVWSMRPSCIPTRRLACDRAWGTDDEQVEPAPVMGVEGDFVAATRSTVDGEYFDGVDSRGDAHVALVGQGLAGRLGLSDVSSGPTIWIDGVSFRVVGIVADSEYLALVTDAVVVPRRRALLTLGEDVAERVLYVRMQRGLADVAAEGLPLRLSPQAPERWAVEVPRVVPLDVAEGISADLRNLSLAMAGLVMFIGVVAIGNAMMRSVYERMSEIGLRRALGAHGGHILGLLVTESAQVGLVAGALGTAAGLLASTAVGFRNDWPLVVSWWASGVAVPAGMLAGAVGAPPRYRRCALNAEPGAEARVSVIAGRMWTLTTRQGQTLGQRLGSRGNGDYVDDWFGSEEKAGHRS